MKMTPIHFTIQTKLVSNNDCQAFVDFIIQLISHCSVGEHDLITLSNPRDWTMGYGCLDHDITWDIPIKNWQNDCPDYLKGLAIEVLPSLGTNKPTYHNLIPNFKRIVKQNAKLIAKLEKIRSMG